MVKLTTVVDPPLNFAGKLYSAIKPNVVQWATGEGSFVMVGLIESLSGKDRDELTSQLRKNLKSLKKSGDNKGTKIVLEIIA